MNERRINIEKIKFSAKRCKLEGKFITFEGIEGAGKSTIVAFCCELLRSIDIKTISIREPGSTLWGESIRQLLFSSHSEELSEISELLLLFASRCQLVDRVIRPQLKKRCVILCDRFSDSSFAYQGGGRGLEEKKIEYLDRLLLEGIQPDLTILLDISLDQAMGRLKLRGKLTKDRIGNENRSFYERVRDSYLKRANYFPDRFRVIDANQPLDNVKKEVEKLLMKEVIEKF